MRTVGVDLLIISVVALCALVFTIVPVIPGTLFVFGGAIALCLDDGWGALPWWFWVGQVVLAGVYLIVDNIMQLGTFAKQGASKNAMFGATIGVIAGPFLTAPLIGPFALLVGPVIGAVGGAIGGEMLHRKRHDSLAAQGPSLASIGLGSFVAFALGTLVKLGIVGAQLTWLALEIFSFH